jgi:hypothetical protein
MACNQRTATGAWVSHAYGTLYVLLPGATERIPAPVAGVTMASIDEAGQVTLSALASAGGDYY